MTDPAWLGAVRFDVYIIRAPGAVEVWEAFGEIFAVVDTGPRTFNVDHSMLEETVEATDNDAIALAVATWCLEDHRDFFLDVHAANLETERATILDDGYLQSQDETTT
jgi:hypothetical protein